MMKVTKFVHKSDINKKWVLIDAKGQSIGRVASIVATVLQGKDKPNYTPNVNMGDNVIVINSSKVKTTGKKASQKFYYRHSGYVGNMKKFSLSNVLSNKPEFVIQHAVRLMLPKNRLAHRVIKGLRIFPDENFPKELKVERTITLNKEG